MGKDFESDGLPPYTSIDLHARPRRRRRPMRQAFRLLFLAFLGIVAYSHLRNTTPETTTFLSVEQLQTDYATCQNLRHVPQDPSGPRERNARYVEGQTPLLIRNATVWTGEPVFEVTPEEAYEGKGFEWIKADVLLRYGLVARVEAGIHDKDLPEGCRTINAQGRHLTAGIVDMHSHTGVDGLPELRGYDDTNELSNDITPFVRSLDGFNPLDPQIQVIKSGGVTTSLILPGSGNNIGGEAFVVKHAIGKANGRPELSIESLLADPDRNWRYMKMACGENAKSVYGKVGRDFGPTSRLGEAWQHAFEEATKLKKSQDDWCATADEVGPTNMDSYLPQELRWESLSAVLRGQVMVNTHCYTIPDLESFVGYTNEFKFPIRAFHHAHSTYLVPEVLKRAYGGRPPASALFADNMNYKAESYVASEKAGKVLYEAGLTPVYVSDNPVLNAQHVVFEAAKAYKNGLKYHVALAGVTSASAELLGLGERIGKVKQGFDADVVIWDSDPLAVGSTPLQVFIDGVPQFDDPKELHKSPSPPLPFYSYRDLQETASEATKIVLTGVSRIQLPGHEAALASDEVVVIKNSSISCVGECQAELANTQHSVIRLENGHIAPALTAFGSLLGMEEIAAEADTQDGANDQGSFSAAVDGLSFEGKNLDAAYAHGVTKGITAPKFGDAGQKGVSVGFRIGAKHALEDGAIFKEGVAHHYTLTPAVKQGSTPSFSSAVAELRRRLNKAVAFTNSNDSISVEDESLSKVVAGEIPLVITVHSADAIVSILRVKKEIDEAIRSKGVATNGDLRLILSGGAESHLVANELAQYGVGVILSPLFSFGKSWDQRRALTGAPLTNGTAIDVLYNAGVKVAIGVNEDWEARDLFIQAGIVRANSNGKINETEALALASTNIYELMGLQEDQDAALREFVVFEGDPLTIQSQVRAVADGRGNIRVWS